MNIQVKEKLQPAKSTNYITLATILLPRIMRVGGGASRELLEVLNQLNVKNPLIITQQTFIEMGHVPDILAPLEAAGMDFEIFTDIPPDPTTDAVNAGIAFLKQGEFDGVVAIGGGSSIDAAKAIAVCGVHGGDISDYKVPYQMNKPGLPIIAIPTTAGTGSEATKVTIITDSESDEKMLLMGIAFQPIAALIDYELTLSKPFRLTADTGIDSLTHAIEAYVSRKASSFSDNMALSAMQLIFKSIRTASFNGDNIEAREAMMLGAMQAGIAFSNASVCLVHGMSRPIGAHFHVPHGLSNAMLLPAITAFSIDSAPERYADCARAMKIANEYHTDEQANEILLFELQSLNDDLEVPTPKEWGIDQDEFFELLPLMASQALGSGSPGNNPKVPSLDEIIELYKDVYA